jgi:hypothetical protein
MVLHVGEHNSPLVRSMSTGEVEVQEVKTPDPASNPARSSHPKLSQLLSRFAKV